MAGLSNAVLEQRELVQRNLQDFIDRAFRSPEDLDPDTLFKNGFSYFGYEQVNTRDFHFVKDLDFLQ